MQENVSGARVVKAYVKESYETKRFGKANDELVDTQLRVLIILSYMTPIMNIILNHSIHEQKIFELEGCVAILDIVLS